MSFALRLIPPGQPITAILAELVPPLPADDAARFADGLAQMRATPRPAPWGNYIAWRDGNAVGCCGFKNVPETGNPPEIGYMTFPAVERSGVATAMAGALVTIAAAAGVAMVIAHTLPGRNPSNRALVRTGFVRAGDAMDADEGPVWRWERVMNT